MFVSDRTPLVVGNLGIDQRRPSVDAALHRLGALESLSSQPRGYAHGADTMMAESDDVRLGIEFLVGAGRHFAHRHKNAALDVGGGLLPRLSDVEQDETRRLCPQFFGDTRSSYFVVKHLVRIQAWLVAQQPGRPGHECGHSAAVKSTPRQRDKRKAVTRSNSKWSCQ